MGIGPDRLVLLVCTLTYPTPDEDGHFARIPAFRERFAPFLIGTSDHTLGVAGGWMTSALGGVCIEKHYTIDKKLPDVPDHAMSVDPPELAEMVARVRPCRRAARRRHDRRARLRAAGAPERAPLDRAGARRGCRRPAGTARDLGYKRPGTGIAPFEAERVIGHSLRVASSRGTVLGWDDLERAVEQG